MIILCEDRQKIEVILCKTNVQRTLFINVKAILTKVTKS